MEKLLFDKITLRKFANIMGLAFLVIAGVIFLKHKHDPQPVFVISCLFFLVGIIAPWALKPFYFVWMKLAFVLGWVNTRLILTAIFYLLFTPIGLCLKLFKVDLLDKRIERNKESYWRKKEEAASGLGQYERQF